MSKILVAGAGGAIAGHLTADLVRQKHEVLSVDIKPFSKWWQQFGICVDEVDLRDPKQVKDLFKDNDFDYVYNLAADMGGIGYITSHHVECMLSSAINTNLLLNCKEGSRFFFSSSACVYSAVHQIDPENSALSEWMAYPALPEDGYGWEKLFSERMCRHFLEERGVETRVARYHNVYGPNGSWVGGREKAPAAICRKVAQAAQHKSDRFIEIWGDGNQTRSFMWVGDCVKGTQMIANSPYPKPLNLGSAELVTINQLVDIVEDIAEVKLERTYDLTAPQGVRGRNSDNTLIQEKLSWEPDTPLYEGLSVLYDWVNWQVQNAS